MGGGRPSRRRHREGRPALSGVHHAGRAVLFGLACAGAFACDAGEGPTPKPEASAEAAVEEPTLRVELVEGRALARVSLPADLAEGLPAGKLPESKGRELLALRGAESEGPPVMGRYEREGNELRFTSAMPLQPGASYVARATVPGLDPREATLETPARAVEEAGKVVAMYPDLETLPANVLRFYVDFSTPMEGADDFFQHVHLIDRSSGEEVEYAWREVQLWSPDRTRITLLVHPGRVKRGITFAKDMGPVFAENGSYEIVIDASVKDASGEPLGQEFRRAYETGERDDQVPDAARWRVSSPSASTKDVLTFDFDEPMDAELLRTRIRVLDSSGAPVEGGFHVAQGGRQWRFEPAESWRAGAYLLSMSGELEDLAGNKPTAPFDKPPDWSSEVTPTLEFRFEVPPA